MASGILNVNKPAGPTSFTVVRTMKRLPGVIKVGHGGTLDPAANGVLPVLVNSATRLTDFVHEWPKSYLATVTFGATSDTDDAEGTITPSSDPGSVSAERIQALLPSFVGIIDQVPPAYSALKQQGEALYRKARRGERPAIPARKVQVLSIDLLDYDASTASARIEVHCGRGVYVRSLARDLGQVLGCGAYLSGLTRLAVGPLGLESAASPADLLAMGQHWTEALLPADLPIRAWPALTLDLKAVAMVRRGQKVDAPDASIRRYRMLDPEGRLVAWGEVQGSAVQPRAVFEP